MQVDTRIYGYIGDGEILCPECAEKGYTEEEWRRVEPELGVLFSHHSNDGTGYSCDYCHEVIFEAYCGECDSFGHNARAWGDDCDEFAEDED